MATTLGRSRIAASDDIVADIAVKASETIVLVDSMGTTSAVYRVWCTKGSIQLNGDGKIYNLSATGSRVMDIGGIKISVTAQGAPATVSYMYVRGPNKS